MARVKETIEVKLEGKEKPRNLLVFMDGTWNDENGRNKDGAVTNIYKMFSSLSGHHENANIPHKKSTAKHLGLYFRGVGNDEENIKAVGYYQGAFGAGERNIRDHAYASICKHYRPGDRICIFGFSRGASSARLLASKLNEHGLPKEITLHYRHVKNKSTDERELLFTHYRAQEENTKEIGVSFLGLFDTVGAFGIPLKLGPLNFQKLNLFRDLTLAPNIDKTLHLVAIDESREPFIPTLTNYDDKAEEIWMPGVHADIGGGYHDCLLGNVALDHMIKVLQENVKSPEVTFSKSIDKWIDYDLVRDDFVIHYHGDGFKKNPRPMHVLKREKPAKLPVKVHKAALTFLEQDNLYFSERFNSFKTRVPISYDPVNLQMVKENLSKIK
jgi:uncharacterized protein (DUF2235 family)